MASLGGRMIVVVGLAGCAASQRVPPIPSIADAGHKPKDAAPHSLGARVGAAPAQSLKVEDAALLERKRGIFTRKAQVRTIFGAEDLSDLVEELPQSAVYANWPEVYREKRELVRDPCRAVPLCYRAALVKVGEAKVILGCDRDEVIRRVREKIEQYFLAQGYKTQGSDWLGGSLDLVLRATETTSPIDDRLYEHIQLSINSPGIDTMISKVIYEVRASPRLSEKFEDWDDRTDAIESTTYIGNLVASLASEVKDVFRAGCEKRVVPQKP